MRRAQLKVDPIAGDDYPAELIVFAFPGGAGTVEANHQALAEPFQGQGRQSSRDREQVGQGKEHRRHSRGDLRHYHPAQFGGPAEPERPDARLLGAIVMTDDVSYYIRMVGPNKTMIKLKPDFDALLSSIEVEGK